MLNQGTSPNFSTTTNKHQSSNPLNHDHDYCSPNKHALPIQHPQPNKHYSNDNLSDSSLSSSLSSSTSKDLTIAHADSLRLLAPQNTPSVLRCNKRASPELSEVKCSNLTEDFSHDQQTTSRSVRAKRARQNTSVTDKSEWITGDEQIDSVLSEHLKHEPKEKELHHHKRSSREHDSTFDQYISSDYSSSDADSDHDSEYNSEDDPDRLWCVCQKPHDGKFMIRCDICLDWFHGHCVGVTKLMGDRFEKQGKEWFCSDCKEKLVAGVPRTSIPKKLVKKEMKKKTTTIPIPGKRGRGRPRKSETLSRQTSTTTRASLRSARKSNSSLDPKLGVDNNRVKKNLARSEARSESFDQFEDGLRLKELIKERKKEFFYKRHLAEQQNAARRNELGLGRQSLTANLSDSLDSLATSTNAPTMINLPINSRQLEKEAPKPNIVLQINTKKDTGDQKNMSARIVTTIVRSPKKTKAPEPVDPIVNDIFTAEPIQIHKKVKQEQTNSSTNNHPIGDANISNSDTAPIKRSGSISSCSRNGSFDQGEITTPKKKRKDSDSSTPNGLTTPIGSKHIIAKIKESLMNRAKQIKDLEVSNDKIEELSIGIEGQLNECFKEGTQKYLNKFRSLLFNLRDTKNQSLIKNVLTGEIGPSRLVRMSPDEMASHELAKWRERENKHSIELIKRDAQLAAQQVIVKKTHKGEEVITAPAFNEPDDPSAVVDNQEPPTTPTKQPNKDNVADCMTIVLTPPPTIGVTNLTVAPLKMKISGIATDSSPPKESPITNVEQFWTGSVSMPDVAKFSAMAKPVSGSIDFSGQELNQELLICGRIAPDQVQGYIKKIRTTTKNQIIIIQIFPLRDEDTNNFDIFFDYLYSRNRYGVISAKDHPDILKDFYVLPIHENGSIPEILKPIQGPGIDRSKPNCLLGLLVRNKRVSMSSTTTTTNTTSSYTPTPIK